MCVTRFGLWMWNGKIMRKKEKNEKEKKCTWIEKVSDENGRDELLLDANEEKWKPKLKETKRDGQRATRKDIKGGRVESRGNCEWSCEMGSNAGRMDVHVDIG